MAGTPIPYVVKTAGEVADAPEGAIPIDLFGESGGSGDLSFSDISGTATEGQIPSLSISKITSLQTTLTDLENRIAALETP